MVSTWAIHRLLSGVPSVVNSVHCSSVRFALYATFPFVWRGRRSGGLRATSGLLNSPDAIFYGFIHNLRPQVFFAPYNIKSLPHTAGYFPVIAPGAVRKCIQIAIVILLARKDIFPFYRINITKHPYRAAAGVHWGLRGHDFALWFLNLQAITD